MATSRRTTPKSVDDHLEKLLAEDADFRERWDAAILARTFALAIVKHRTEHGLTQSELGAILGVPQSQIARIEDGEHTPSLPTMLRVCDLLGLELTLRIRPRSAQRLPAPAAGRGVADASGQVTIAIRPARRRLASGAQPPAAV